MPTDVGIGNASKAINESLGLFNEMTKSLGYERTDEVVITVRLAESGKASLVLDQQALRGGEVLAEGRIRIGCVDAQTLRPRRIPSNLLASIGTA